MYRLEQNYEKEDPEYDIYELEVIDTVNPILVNLCKEVVAIELEQFFWKPPGVEPTQYLGIEIPGAKGRYNQFGYLNSVVKTIPFKSPYYDFLQPKDLVPEILNSLGGNFTIGFIDKSNTTNLARQYINFDSKYLVNFTLYTKKSGSKGFI